MPELVRNLEPVLELAASEYELILVDDGSSDGTWQVIEELAQRCDWVRGVSLIATSDMSGLLNGRGGRTAWR